MNSTIVFLTRLFIVYVWICALHYAFAQTVPNEVKQAISASLAASNSPTADDKKGQFHEEGGMWGKTTDGKLVVLVSNTGRANKGCDEGASLDIGNFVHPELAANLATILGEWHIHPAGVRPASGDSPGCYLIQPPSAQDLAVAVCPINIVVGAANKLVYFYDLKGVTQTVKLKDFLR